MKKLFFASLAILCMGVFSCTSNATSNSESAEQPKENKILVAYFSATGNTKKVAETIADLKVSAPDAVFKPGKVLFKTEGVLTDVDKNIVEEWIKSVN